MKFGGTIWEKPLVSFFKYNVDATMFSQFHIVRVRLVLRNELGCFVCCRVIFLPNLVLIREWESIGLMEALSWIEEYLNVIFE